MVKLENYDAFNTILSNYRPDEKAINLLQSTKVALMVGPSSVGKNTIIEELVETGNFTRIISDTTRPPRVNNGHDEVDGETYHFKSEDEFLEGLQNGEYLEAEIIHSQQVSGIKSSELKRVKSSGTYGVNEIDVKGAERLHSLSQNVHAFFLLPPNFTSWMNRMTARGAMEADEVQRRLVSAEHELQHALDTDDYTYIINDNIRVAVTEIITVLNGQSIDQEEHKETAWKLLNELKSNTSS